MENMSIEPALQPGRSLEEGSRPDGAQQRKKMDSTLAPNSSCRLVPGTGNSLAQRRLPAFHSRPASPGAP